MRGTVAARTVPFCFRLDKYALFYQHMLEEEMPPWTTV
jgi:hypothetical protein